jgi:hypothetical protein
VTSDCKSSKISGLAFANIQGKSELILHHFDKNIMKKAVCWLQVLVLNLQEDYIKPIVIEDDRVLQTIPEDLVQIKGRYQGLIASGKLEKELSRLSKLQKRALTSNGPHPHHQNGYIGYSNNGSGRYIHGLYVPVN